MKTIDNHFGISESSVSHAGKRAGGLIASGRELKKRVQAIEKKLPIACSKSWPLSFSRAIQVKDTVKCLGLSTNIVCISEADTPRAHICGTTLFKI